jgi:hypothetical protein
MTDIIILILLMATPFIPFAILFYSHKKNTHNE